MWSCDSPQWQDAVFFVLFYRSSTLFVVYPLTLPLCIKKFCISGTACPPSGQVSGRLVLVLIEQDVAQWEQLELRKLEDLSRLSRALRIIYTTCGFLMYTQCIVTSSLKKKIFNEEFFPFNGLENITSLSSFGTSCDIFMILHKLQCIWSATDVSPQLCACACSGTRQALESRIS